MLAFILIILGIVARLIIHVPNFTPVIAIALFGGVYLKRKQAVILPVVLMAVTDFFLGFHQTMMFTYGSLIVIALAGVALRKNNNFANAFVFSTVSAIGFFIVTNFGVWAMQSMYAKNFSGLIECYVMAIPFFKNTLLATYLYGGVLFGGYEFLAKRLGDTRFAHVL